MPASNTTSSPIKRPGLGRRAVSSHAVVTRANSSSNALDPFDQFDVDNPPSHALKPHHVSRHHHHPRTHLVGGGHRHHHHHHHHSRNPSFGKNVNKLHRLTAGAEAGRNHTRKKSAPATPAASPPRGGTHVRWGDVLEEPHPQESIKKNNSSPALRRYTTSSGVAGKKNLVSDRPRSSSGKKTVGFELGVSDNDDGEWEDTTQSPESTRRGSVAQAKESVENAAALVDPLIFVKRPYPQFPRATSLPEPTIVAQEGHSTDEEEGKEEQKKEQQQEQENKQRELSGQVPESGAIASRLISPSLSAKAPPAMSSISAMAKPAVVENTISRQPSLSTLASGQDFRRTASSTPALANTPSQTQATSSSIDGGVSRFIVSNKAGNQPLSTTDSDPYTPSSFLPHYHPQTPPSPGNVTDSRKTRASPPTRRPGIEPPSRTQQKLWLQRTAALNTSPPDSASATVSPSAIDPAFMAAGRSGSDAGRNFVNGTARSGGPVSHDNEAKQTRKVYEKTALELTVVRRFQSPTADSFDRLRAIIQETRRPSSSHGNQPVQRIAPSLAHFQPDAPRNGNQSSEPRQLLSRRMPNSSRPSVYLQQPDTDDSSANVSDSGQLQRNQHPSQRILSTSDDTATGDNPSGDDEDADSNANDYPNEDEMMIRRMWESRIVASSA